MKYLVLTGNEDDNLDTDVGFRGTAQFIISVQRANATIGDTFTETDSNGSTTNSNASEDALPRQYLKVAKFTHIQRSSEERRFGKGCVSRCRSRCSADS